MQVVGVDFGTTNVRISTWDSTQDLPPEPKMIGAQGTTTMPAVIALRRQPGGEVISIVGEDADILQDDPNDTLVIRNIKRNALSNDAYVDWHLEIRNSHEQTAQWPPVWWSPQKRCVQAWGHEFPVWDLIGMILVEAFHRADIKGEFVWRAGCPVHANFEYRDRLAQTLGQSTGKGNATWIVDEPILLLTLARRLGNIGQGSYLVYDLGGGSFDSALVEVKETEMLVYGADGHPLLGGADIDDDLIDKLAYLGQANLMRDAKERLTPSNPTETLSDGTIVTWGDVENTLQDRGFARKSFSTMRDAYVGAKVLWKRSGGEDDPPIGEILGRDDVTGAVRSVWQLMWDDLTQDVDGIIVFGGPTRSPYFYQQLSDRFGEKKIITTEELLPTLFGTPDLELVGVSMGACYSYEGAYSPLYLSRLPARITLEDLQTGSQVEYEPFQHFQYAHVEGEPIRRIIRTARQFEPYFSNRLVQDKSDPHRYELTVTDPSGVVIEQHLIDGYVKPGEEEREQHPDRRPRLPATSLRLVIDRFGRVGVEKHSSGPRLPWTEISVVIEAPPWQIGLQREAAEMERVIKTIRESTFSGGSSSQSERGYIEGVDSPYPQGRRA